MSEVQTEPGKCPLCGPTPGSASSIQIGDWSYDRCQKCATLFLNPRVVESDMLALYARPEYYDSAEQRGGYQTYVDDRQFYLRTYRRRLALIRSKLPIGARVLDVGSGFGYMVEVISAAGFEAWALDVPGTALARCAELVGERAVPLPEADRRLTPACFDAITLFDVFEHLYEPRAALERYRTWLKPGGFLMMTTPDCQSMLARWSGRRWVSYKPPEHVFLYNRASIVSIAQEYFEHVGDYGATQDVSLAFLADRVGRLVRPAGFVLGGLARIPGLRRVALPVTSGSVTYVGRRRRAAKP